MKKIYPLLILCISLVFVSCKKDDDGDDNSFLLSVNNLSGTHNITFYSLTKVVSGEFEGLPVSVTTTITADTYDADITLKQDETFDTSGAFRKKTNITDGNTTTDNETITIFGEEGTFRLDANTMTVVFTGFQLDIEDLNIYNLENGLYNITLFNENEVRLVQENMISTGGETREFMTEIRLVRQ